MASFSAPIRGRFPGFKAPGAPLSPHYEGSRFKMHAPLRKLNANCLHMASILFLMVVNLARPRSSNERFELESDFFSLSFRIEFCGDPTPA
mgnify:CR=1 FL=1